jgi:hypothetical protein
MHRITRLPAVLTRSTGSHIDCVMIFIAANQCAILISTRIRRAVCPLKCIIARRSLLACAIEGPGSWLHDWRNSEVQLTLQLIELRAAGGPNVINRSLA